MISAICRGIDPNHAGRPGIVFSIKEQEFDSRRGAREYAEVDAAVNHRCAQGPASADMLDQRHYYLNKWRSSAGELTLPFRSRRFCNWRFGSDWLLTTAPVRLKFRDCLIHCQMSAKVADRLLQLLCAQKIANSCMRSNNSQLHITLCELAVKPREHPRAGDINHWGIGKVAYHEAKLRRREKPIPGDLA